MKAEVRISIKDYRRNKNLKVLLFRPPFQSRTFVVRLNGERWPASGRTVSLTGLLAAIRRALARSLAL